MMIRIRAQTFYSFCLKQDTSERPETLNELPKRTGGNNSDLEPPMKRN